MAEARPSDAPDRPTEKTVSPATSAQQTTAHADGGHGHSVAAWTAVTVILVGCLVMSFAVVLAQVWLFVVGAVVVVIGAILGKVMSAMGFGPNVTLDSAAEHQGGRGKDEAPEGVR